MHRNRWKHWKLCSHLCSDALRTSNHWTLKWNTHTDTCTFTLPLVSVWDKAKCAHYSESKHFALSQTLTWGSVSVHVSVCVFHFSVQWLDVLSVHEGKCEHSFQCFHVCDVSRVVCVLFWIQVLGLTLGSKTSPGIMRSFSVVEVMCLLLRVLVWRLRDNL